MVLHVYYKKQLKQVTGIYISINSTIPRTGSCGQVRDRSTSLLVNVNAGLSVLARALSSRGYGTACTRCSGTRPGRSSSFTLDAQVLLSVRQVSQHSVSGTRTVRLSWPSSGAVAAAG